MTDRGYGDGKFGSIVVTGAAGFIGSALTDLLVSHGHNVIGIDRRRPSKWGGGRFIESDLTAISIDDLRGVEQPSAMIHLASVVGVVEAGQSPEKTYSAIVDLTEAAILLARRLRSQTFLYVSSSEVYGNPADAPIVETTPLRPLSAYAHAKARSEQLVADYAAEDDTRLIVVRPFNVYGPGQRTSFVVPRFLDSALRGEDLTIVGTGQQTRTFTFIDDFVKGLVLALIHAPNHARLNIAGKECVSISSLARMTIQATGSSSGIRTVSAESLGRRAENEVYVREASSELARRLLGYVPDISLATGLELIIEREHRL